ncbi:MAG: hypothetical protein HW375_619 [Anaerolineales bacterium]|nr:hypothetical protein [Anaerolineales bacterium]
MNHRPSWLLSAVLFLVLASCASAPSAQTLEEARQVVLDEVVQPESLDHPVIVFALPDPLRSGDQIGPYNKEGYGPAVVPTTIEEDSWFFWIDDAPGARFSHPGRFVLISPATGEVTVAEHAWWPVLNGQGLWTEGDAYWDEGNWAFSNMESGPQGSSPPADGRARIGLAAPSAQSAGPGAALVINGWESGESGEADFETDADGMHDILTDAGFDVTYLGPQEDANPDRDGEATSSNRLDWLHEKSEELQPGDTLVIYVTAHGGVTEDGTGGIGNVFEDLLLKDLQKFDPGVHIIVFLDSCYSGSFADTIRQVADVTVMSTSGTDPSYGDIDPLFFEGWFADDPNPDDEGSEFTSGAVEDWDEIMADPQQRAAVEARAAEQGTNFWEELVAASYVSAVEKDVTALSGWTFPSLVRGVAETRPTPVPTTTVLQDGLNDGVSCVTGEPLSGGTPAGVDISRAVVDLLLDESADEPEQVRFTIELDQAPPPTTALFGGVEFADGSTPISPLNPQWYYDGIGNKNFSFGIRGAGVTPELHLYDPSTGWTSSPNTSFWVAIDGNRILITMPVSEIPANSPFYVSLSDYSACDAVGLDDDRRPIGELPWDAFLTVP